MILAALAAAAVATPTLAPPSPPHADPAAICVSPEVLSKLTDAEYDRPMREAEPVIQEVRKTVSAWRQQLDAQQRAAVRAPKP